MIKFSISFIFLSVFLIVTAFSQSNQAFDQDSTNQPLRLTFENLIDNRTPDFQMINFQVNQQSSFLNRKEVLSVLDFSRSVLDNNTISVFNQNFKPLSVSEYNNFIKDQQVSGQFSISRPSNFGLFRFN